jgi:hypothetical protein
MAIDETTEERAARARRRQDKRTPFLINEADARLYPNTELMRKRPGYRLYHGDPKADLATRKRYLLGLTQRREVKYDAGAEALPEFDLNTAGIDEILTFATEQYGVVLDPNMPIARLRRRVFELSQMTDEQLLHEIGTGAPVVAAAGQQALGAGTGDEPAGGDELAKVARQVAQRQAAEGASLPPSGLGLGGVLGRVPDADKALEPPPPTRGGRQPHDKHAGAKREAGTPAAA